jgi:hypothetical protein
MTKDEAIHKALKVLNCLNNDRIYEAAWVKGAINACEEALEQPAMTYEQGFAHGYEAHRVEQGCLACVTCGELAQEPVALIKHENGNYSPKHQWQGLTDDEIVKISNQCDLNHVLGLIDFGRAIEAKLKEKNTVTER